MFIGSLSSNVTRDVLYLTLRPSSAVAMVNHFQKLAWLSARSGCCFSSYLHLTLTVFHQLIIPLRYLTIKFRNQSLFPLLCIVRAVSSQGPSLLHPYSNLVVSSIIIICLRAMFLAALVSSWSVYGLLVCGGCFFTFPTFCSRRMPMIAPILHPRFDSFVH